MTPEELASTMEGHATSCDQAAAYHRNRLNNCEPWEKEFTERRDLVTINEAKAETLRQWAARIREELAQVQQLVTESQHILVIDDKGWVIEHSLYCRLNNFMASCGFTVWAREYLNGSRVYPHGRFRMDVEDPHRIVLEPA